MDYFDKLEKAEKLVNNLIKESGDRSDFDEPDRNEIDDVPDDNPEKTLKDIEKEVTEAYLEFAKDILSNDIESAASKIAESIAYEHGNLSEGEVERLKVKYMKRLNSKK